MNMKKRVHLLTGFFFIAEFGVLQTALAAAALNLVIEHAAITKSPQVSNLCWYGPSDSIITDIEVVQASHLANSSGYCSSELI